jgi:hypothetical protein
MDIKETSELAHKKGNGKNWRIEKKKRTAAWRRLDLDTTKEKVYAGSESKWTVVEYSLYSFVVHTLKYTNLCIFTATAASKNNGLC